MDNLNFNSTLIYFLFCFFICVVLLQIYILLKLKSISRKLSKLFFKFDMLYDNADQHQNFYRATTIKSCQNCKNRIVFFHSDEESYFYLKCRINNKAVNQQYFCNYFILDPQNYKI